MARVLLIEDSPLQRWLLCRQLQALGHEPLPAQSCAQALALLTPGACESADAGVAPRGSVALIDAALVALPLLEDNGFQCGMQLREAGVHPVLLLADVARETDAWWARSLALGTSDGVWTVLLRPLPLQTLDQALTAATQEARHGRSA